MDLLAHCFKTYIEANWCESTISIPDTVAVYSKDDTTSKYIGRPQTVLLINRGVINFIPVDIGVKFREWRTSLYLQETTSVLLQGIIDEFYRVIHSWETNGGGTFSSNDSDHMKIIDSMSMEPRRGDSGDRAANIELVLRSFYEEVST